MSASPHDKGVLSEIEVTPKYPLGYRKDIQGLRAIAILLVLAAHFGLPWLEGGFVGVDIFFVISGFLITGLILKEIEQKKSLNLLKFYSARLKRLLPALLFVIVTTSLLSIFLLSPTEQHQQSRSGLAAIFWVSNIFFSFTNKNYFDSTNDENLFLHTWSLGVEEQFYLIWPLILAVILGIYSKTSKIDDSKNLLRKIIFITICGYALSFLISFLNPLFGFYLMPSRIWQFGAGALVFIYSQKNDVNSNSLRVHGIRFAPWVGVIFILGTALLIDSETYYPGWIAIVPTVGAMFLLFSCANNESSLISKVVSSKPFQWIGDISYSLYLWHWPILIFGHMFFPGKTWLLTITLIALSFLMAVGSYTFVENKFRRSKYLSRHPLPTILASISIILSASFLLNLWSTKSTDWSQLPEQKVFADVRSDMPILYSMGCDEWYFSSDVRLCGFGSETAEHTAVLFGDSVLAQWFSALEPIYTKANWEIIVITKSSCPIIDEPYFYERIGREYTECEIWRNQAIEWIKVKKPDILFFGNSETNFNQIQWVSGTNRILEQVSADVGNAFIIQPTLTLPFDGPSCLGRKKWQSQFAESTVDCSATVSNVNNDNIYSWLQDLTDNYENADVLNFNEYICPDNTCMAEREDQVIYRDAMHLTSSFLSTLSNTISKEIELKISE